MSEAVLRLFPALRALYAEERAEITHRLWHSVPDIKQELFTEYDQELFEDIEYRIEHLRDPSPVRLTPEGAALSEQALAMPHNDRLDITHLLWQSLPSMYGLFGEDDPEFIAELNRRIADMDSGKTVGIPHEEVMRRMKDKYG